MPWYATIFFVRMKALKIDPWHRTITQVFLDLWPATSTGGKPPAQEDKALCRALACSGCYVLESLSSMDRHRLVIHPDQQHLLAGPTFSLLKAPRKWFGGHAFILAVDDQGFHAPCRLAPLDARALVRFR